MVVSGGAPFFLGMVTLKEFLMWMLLVMISGREPEAFFLAGRRSFYSVMLLNCSN